MKVWFFMQRWQPVWRAATFALLAVFVGISQSDGVFISPAYACPPGAVFSAFNGKGLCLRSGQGLSVMAECRLTAGGGKKKSCSEFETLHNRNTDPANYYCCPSEKRAVLQTRCSVVGTAPFCSGSCKTKHPLNQIDRGASSYCVTGHKLRCCTDYFAR